MPRVPASLVAALLESLFGQDRIDEQDGRRHGELEGGLEISPGGGEWERVQGREGAQCFGEIVVCREIGVGLDVHEDGQSIQLCEEGLVVRLIHVLRLDEGLDRIGPIGEEFGEEGLDGGILGWPGEYSNGTIPVLGGAMGGDGRVIPGVEWVVAREAPVDQVGHVVGRDGQDMEEALFAPSREVLLFEEGQCGRVLQAEDRVGHLELILLETFLRLLGLALKLPGIRLVLALIRLGLEVEQGEIAIVVGEGLGQPECGF